MVAFVPLERDEMKVVALRGESCTPSCLARLPISLYREQPSQNALPWILIRLGEKVHFDAPKLILNLIGNGLSCSTGHQRRYPIH